MPFLVRSGNGGASRRRPPDTLVSLDRLPADDRAPCSGFPGAARSTASICWTRRGWTREALPPIRMLTGGAARAVVVRQVRKLIFFDRFGTRGLPDEPGDPMGHRVALHLGSFLPALGWFDLRQIRSSSALLAPWRPAWTPTGGRSRSRWRMRRAASSCASRRGAASRKPRAHDLARPARPAPSASPSKPKSRRICLRGGRGTVRLDLDLPPAMSTASLPDSQRGAGPAHLDRRLPALERRALAPGESARSGRSGGRRPALRDRSGLPRPLRLAQRAALRSRAARRRGRGAPEAARARLHPLKRRSTLRFASERSHPPARQNLPTSRA